MIWRRVLVSPPITLCELHGALKVGIGWDGIHVFSLMCGPSAMDLWNCIPRAQIFL